MEKTTDVLGTEIYPRLFERLDSALPEFEFTATANGWRSTNDLKITGERGEVGKVAVWREAIYWLNDWTRRPGIDIYNYIKVRDGLTESKDVLQRLADLASYTLSNDSLTPEAIERIEMANKKAKLWEDANTFFIDCLSHKENAFANTPGAGSVRSYLTETRGYLPSLFLTPGQRQDKDNPKMEVGYVPSLFDLQAHLVDQVGYAVHEVAALLTDKRIGDTHRLAIPYRDPSGRIRGMVFRSTTGSDRRAAEPKYLYSAGLEKKSILFNLKAVTGQKDIVIVEGVLDALHATAVGIPNVVAIGGSGGALSADHIETAIKYGAKKITLLLDNDRAGWEGTDKALELLLQFPRIRPYVAFVDEQYKDLDSLLTAENGVEAAKVVIANAVAGWAHLLERILNRYGDIQHAPENNGILPDKEIDNLKAELIATAARLSLDEGEQFIQEAINFEPVARLGISTQTLLDMKETLRKVKAKEQRSKDAKKLVTDAQALLNNGQENKALELLRSKSREIKETDKENQFTVLSSPYSEQKLVDRLRTKPDSLESGFSFTDRKGEPDPITIPAGQITILAGATSHGKTVLLTNMALNLCQLYPTKTFHVFSYEQDEETYLVNSLNAYIGDGDLAFNNRNSIEHYFQGKPYTYWTNRLTNETVRYNLWKPGKDAIFHQKRQQFFQELIDSGRLNIHYVNYDSDTLIDAIKYLLKTEPLGAVLTDYVQLINLPSERNKGLARQEEIKRMCQDFNQLSNETGIPLIFGAQFNREVTNLAQMHPTKLGEAGDLERIANLIIGLWNNHWPGLNPSKEDKIKIEERISKEPDPNTWYVEALKRRGGQVGAWDIWDYIPNAGKVKNRQ